ncbi:MAG: flagellar hook-length control protein FliK [Pseudomonadota bacterium]
MAQSNILLALNTTPTARSATPSTSSQQDGKRRVENHEPASSKAETAARHEREPEQTRDTPFERVLQDGMQERSKKQSEKQQPETPVDTASTRESTPTGLFSGNPLPLAGQSLPPVAAAAAGEFSLGVFDTSANSGTANALSEAFAGQTTAVTSGPLAETMPAMASNSLFASSSAQPSLFDLDGPEPSLFASAQGQTSLLQMAQSPAATAVLPESGLVGAANDASVASAPGFSFAQTNGAAAVIPGLMTGAAQSAGQQAAQQLGPQPAPQHIELQQATPVTASGTVSAAEPLQQLPTAITGANGAMLTQSSPSASEGMSLDDVTGALAQAAAANASAAVPEAEALDPALIATTQTATETVSTQEQSTGIAWQLDAAERARAWRGLSSLESVVGQGQGVRHEFSVNSTTGAGQGGQLQQFAEALRQAGSGGDAGLASAGFSSTISTGSQSGSASATLLSADRGTSTFNAGSGGSDPLNQTSQAWRTDSTITGAPATGARGAAGTLGFMQNMQGMQASSFGQPLGAAFGESEWAESVTRRVALMAGEKVSSAQIELDPPELGAMTVRISVTGDQANVSFTSAHAQVREALEQTFTRLQDMLGQQGLQLADAQVSDQPAARQQQGEGRGGQGGSFADENNAGPVTMQSVKAPTGLVDYYA